MKKILKTAAIGALVLLPLLSLAQATPPAETPTIPGDIKFATGGLDKVIGIINQISLIMLYALLILAGVFIVYAAYLYLTAAGDAEKVKSASNVIIYAAVAIGVGLLSRVVVAIARGLVQ